MRKMFYMLSVLTLALVVSCTTNSLESAVLFEAESFKKDSDSIAGKDSWQSYGVVRLENKDSVYMGDPYIIRYASGNSIKVFFDNLNIDKIVPTGSTSYHIQVNSLLDVFIEEIYEDENEISFVYTTKSKLDEYNMNSFKSFTLEKTNSEESMFISGIRELIESEESEVEAKWGGVTAGRHLAYLIIKYIIDDGQKESCTDQAIRACGDNGVQEVHSSFGKCNYKCK